MSCGRCSVFVVLLRFEQLQNQSWFFIKGLPRETWRSRGTYRRGFRDASREVGHVSMGRGRPLVLGFFCGFPKALCVVSAQRWAL